MRSVRELLDIDKMCSSSYKPFTIAVVERFHRTLSSMLGEEVSGSQRDWVTMLPFVMAAYRSSVHTTTYQIPNSLVFGREVRAPIDVVLGLRSDENMSTYNDFVEKLTQKLRYVHSLVREQLGRTAERAKRYYTICV